MTEPTQTRSRIGTYLAALGIALLALVQSMDINYSRVGDRSEMAIATKDELPVHLLIPELVILGWLLGLPISPNLLAAILKTPTQ